MSDAELLPLPNEAEKKPDLNSNGAATPTQSAPKASVQHEPWVPVKQKLSGLTKTVLAFSFLGAAAAVGLGGYLWYVQQKGSVVIEQRSSELRHDLDERVTQQNAQIQQLTAKLESLSKTAASQEQLLGDLQKHANDTSEKLASITGLHRIDFLFAEVEHYVRLSEQVLSLSGDTQYGYALLETADKIAARINEPLARPLRDAFAGDLQTLRNANRDAIDVDGIFLRLSKLIDTIPQLTLPAVTRDEKTPDEQDKQDLDEMTFATATDNFVDYLKSLVEVRRLDEGYKPLVLPDQRIYLEQNLQLLFEQAQLAALRQDQGAFTAALNQAERWIKSYFQTQKPEVKGVLETIADLQKRQIKPPVPDIKNSVQSVAVFADAWHKEKMQRDEREAQMRNSAAQPAAGNAP
ncbi:MAG TPA: uroporphyrinogen-III C-methyltransferase [Pseudomonadales bacterium]|nr:uroporphyrinogen-III C-methyltransferase [Pseudomonadales bacterium]